MTSRDPPRAPGGEPEPNQGPTREEEDREAILARRALFIASALAGIGLAVGCDGAPRPCLSPMAVERDAEPPPMPCLTPMRNPDAPTDAGAPPPDADASLDASSAQAPPDASTKPRPPPPMPRPCLTTTVPNPPPPPPPAKK